MIKLFLSLIKDLNVGKVLNFSIIDIFTEIDMLYYYAFINKT